MKTEPAGLAVSNSGMVYFAAFITGGSGLDGFFKLDTNTGQVKDYGIDSFGNNQLRVVITADNSRVFFNHDGAPFTVEAASDKVTYASTAPGCCYGDYDLTISASQNTVEATSYLYDASLNAESYLALNDREAMNINYVYGAKLSADGRMLFLPSTNGIDIFDGRLGKLLKRISLPVALSRNFDALVSDGMDNVLIAITGQTGSGIAIIDLTSLTEPAPLAYEATSSDVTSMPLQDGSASTQISLRRHLVVSAVPNIPITVKRHEAGGVFFGKQ